MEVSLIMRTGRLLLWFVARVFVSVVAFMGVVFVISAAAHVSSIRGASLPTDVIVPATTTTELTTSPASPVTQGTMVTLTVTVTPATAAGTVQFKDGTTDLGRPVMVSNGTAVGSTSRLAPGSRQFTAVFIPSDTAAFTVSTSRPVPFVVTGPAATNTVLTSSASQVTQGSNVTLTATVTPAAAAGTVRFKDGAAILGSPVMVSNGTASVTTVLPNVESCQLTAEFTPSDPGAFSPSKSPPLLLTVIKSRQKVTPQAQQSGRSLDGPAGLDGRGGLTVIDLGGRNDGRGVTVLDGRVSILDGRVSILDGGNVNGGRGLTLLDLNLDLGRRNSRSGLALLDDPSPTLLSGGSEGLLSNLLHALR